MISMTRSRPAGVGCWIAVMLLAACSHAQARSLRQTEAASTTFAVCPISSSDDELDFSPVTRACNNTGDVGAFCSGCICSLVDVYLPAFRAANLTLDQGSALDAAASIIQVCTREYYVPLLLADVNVTSLEELGACDFTPANIPPCLLERVGQLRSDPDVAAFAGNATANLGAEYYYEDDVVLVSANQTGAVAGVIVSGVASLEEGGVQAALAGQIDSFQQLLGAMLNSSELLEALSEERRAKLQAFASDEPAVQQFAANLPAGYLASITSPVDANAFIDGLPSEGDAAEPADPAQPADPAEPADPATEEPAAGAEDSQEPSAPAEGEPGSDAAPAPAPANGASAAVPSLAGAILGALLLLV